VGERRRVPGLRRQKTSNPISQDVVHELAELLRRCTARVAPSPNAKGGAGFFIDEQHLLTCWHVVKQTGPCTVWPEERPQRSGTVITGCEELDIALVRVDDVTDEPSQPTVATPQPSVVMRSEFDNGPVLVSGYPRKGIADLGHQNRGYTGQRNTVGGVLTAIRLAGENVTFGQSGGPVLDLATGAVVAIARWSDAPGGVAGGGATSIAAAEKWLTDNGETLLGEVLRTPPVSATRWRKTIGDSGWAALGYPDARELVPTLDIRIASVDGQRGSWQVFVDTPAGSASTLTVHDLGDDVADILFHWGQRGRLHTEDEVSLFGRLLSSALFPQLVQRRLAAVQAADTALVRLVMGDDALANVPWELAATPGGSECFLAADEKLRLCRVVSTASTVAATDTPKVAKVVGIVVQRADLHDIAPVVVNDREARHWPAVEKVVSRLAECLDLPAYQGHDLLENPRPDEVEDRLHHPCDVVHYIGFGRWERDQFQLAFADDEGRLDFHPAAKLFQWVRQAGARLVVIELATPPPDVDLDPVPSGEFAAALGESVGAVVFTSVPVHPLLYQPFNRSLYELLATGRTIEEAVQLSRKSLNTNVPLDDHAAFGWFALMTGNDPGIRVVEPAATTPESAATRSLAHVGSEPSPSPEAAPGGRIDAFQG
jgi:hypothetical protein